MDWNELQVRVGLRFNIIYGSLTKYILHKEYIANFQSRFESLDDSGKSPEIPDTAQASIEQVKLC